MFEQEKKIGVIPVSEFTNTELCNGYYIVNENTFNFIELGKTYAFTKREYYWSPNDLSKINGNYEYISAGRCKTINKNEFLNEKKVKIAKKTEDKKRNIHSLFKRRKFKRK